MDAGVLVQLDGPMPMPWPGPIVPLHEFGSLCTRAPDRLAVWAPGDGGWTRACRLLALVRSAAPEVCLVLTDRRPVLERVPRDIWIATVASGCQGSAERGAATYTCADLRSDRIFRLLRSGRARGHPERRPLLDLHALATTDHGGRLLGRWTRILAELFGEGTEGAMPDALRADLDELGSAARDAEHAATGGFHSLHPEARDAVDWEAGCRRYLLLAASRSAGARAVVERWLTRTAGWESSRCPDALRVAAAAALRRLVDDPWLPAPTLAELLQTWCAR